MISENEYELYLRSDTNNPKYRLWFYFCVRNYKPAQKVLFHVVNFSKSKSLYRDGMSPTVRCASKPRWERLNPKHVFYYKSQKKDQKNQYVLSFVHIFDKANEPYYFCYSYPFSYTHQQMLLADLDRRQLPYVTRDLLCRTVQHRRCDVLTIGTGVTASGGVGAVPGQGKRKVVLMTCRIHPGETPCSHTMRGFLDFLVSDHEHAAALRDHVTFVIVPMLNPDGCYHGNYRTCSLGTDLNRAWAEPSPVLEPTLLKAKELALKYENDPECDLDFFVDCHAHTCSKNSFLFCNPPADRHDIEKWERTAALPRLMDINCGAALGFSLAACKFCADPQKAGTGRRVVGDLLESSGTMCYTLEMSFYSPPPQQEAWSATTSNEETYENFGRAMGFSFVDYYGLRANTKSESVMRRVENAKATAAAASKNGSGSATIVVTGDAMFGFGESARDAVAAGATKPWHRTGGAKDLPVPRWVSAGNFPEEFGSPPPSRQSSARAGGGGGGGGGAGASSQTAAKAKRGLRAVEPTAWDFAIPDGRVERARSGRLQTRARSAAPGTTSARRSAGGKSGVGGVAGGKEKVRARAGDGSSGRDDGEGAGKGAEPDRLPTAVVADKDGDGSPYGLAQDLARANLGGRGGVKSPVKTPEKKLRGSSARAFGPGRFTLSR